MKRQEKTMRLRYFGMNAGWAIRLAIILLLLAVTRHASAGSIEPVSHWVRGYNNGFAVSQDRAYMIQGSDLIVLDVADPLKPVQIRQLPLSFEANNLVLAADRNRLYLSRFWGDQPGQLAICDISNPDAPVIHDPITLPNSLRGVAVNGNLLGMAFTGDGLRLMDATDLTSPVLRGTYPEPKLDAVAMAGHFAYLASNTALRILDVSDPTSPTQVGQMAGQFSGPCVVNGHYLYVNEGSYACAIIDVTDPAHPSRVSTSSGHGDNSFLVAGTQLYCDDWSKKALVVYDITDPAHPVCQGSCYYPDYHQGLNLSGETLFLNSDSNGIDLVSVHDPSHPRVIGHYLGICWQPIFNGTQAYLMQGSGILPVDFSNPAAPAPQPYYPIPELKNLVWDSQQLYALAEQGGRNELLVLDSSDPTSLTIKGRCLMPVRYNDYVWPGPMLQAGSGLVFASYYDINYYANNVTEVYDVHDLANIKLACTLGAEYDDPFPSIAYGPDHLVYLGWGTILDIMDFTDPADPQRVNSIKYGEHINISIKDGQLHVRSVSNSFINKELAYNLTDPVHPRLVDYQTVNSFYNLFFEPTLRLQGHDYYLVDGSQSGHYTLDLIDGANPIEPRRIAQYSSHNNFDTYPMTPFSVGGETYALNGGSLNVFRFNTAPPPIFVGTPLNMQSISRGDLLPVHWQTDTAVAGTAVRLELWSAQGAAAQLGSAWSETGETTTTVRVPAVPDGDYTLRATSAWNPQLYAESLITLKISGGDLRLLAPVGGESWLPGQTVTVRWTGDPDKVGNSLRFELWRGTHKLATLGTAQVRGGESEIQLALPAGLEPGGDYYLLAASQDNDAVFAQNPAPVTITGGQVSTGQ